MIVIPDIHGRSFWKDVVKGREEDEIVFLGDYLDPYPFDWDEKDIKAIRENAIFNFKDIIEFKKSHMKNVILLLGNHDCEYLYGTSVCDCRCDHANYQEISDLFIDNKDLFQLAYEKYINDKHFVFVHAGILKEWADQWLDNYNMTNIVDMLNNKHFLYIDSHLDGHSAPGPFSFRYALGFCSSFRGGWDFYSSPVWTDVRELDRHQNDFPEIFQVVGHTYATEAILGDNYVMLDCKKGFILNEEGDFAYMDGTPVVKNNE